MNILHVDSSSLGSASVSRQLTADIVAHLRQANPSAQVVRRDLAETTLPHLDGELLQVVKFQNIDDLNDRQKAELALSTQLLEEFLAADVVVIGAPMYNFGVPSQLKAWIDRIAQPGRTFRYTAAGPEGLAGGRKVIIASARGGKYAGLAHEGAMDHQEAFLRAFLGFIGITDVQVIRAEGVAMGPDAAAAALDGAKAEIGALAV
ncbi:NAD(P)H-dependent oxidoreductase [Magnetospirillum sp. 64-120]|uniref:FMN-dependent NADH-azoreductase n=1 Tax=Magnetospirillum sp. 64-120 TaxID=1895778 RepID=UPI00092B58E4|nr:NAD(P)H-dependent oxidoreductase [Magnetospirillum sp. 64-120]OJX81185.1 MAG: FMN-dependent NADH-azoreductase [Magnetospirillum sp. 64-120]